MQDAIIAGTGNSRVLKTAPGALERYPTHEALMQAFEDGSFLFDFLRNPSGYMQLGTDLKKETMLQDATAALVGLGAAATPNDMLAVLASKFNGKFQLGTRVGNGTKTFTIAFNGNPLMVIVQGFRGIQVGSTLLYYPSLIIAVKPMTHVMGLYLASPTGSSDISVSWSGNLVTFSGLSTVVNNVDDNSAWIAIME